MFDARANYYSLVLEKWGIIGNRFDSIIIVHQVVGTSIPIPQPSEFILEIGNVFL